MAKVQEMVTIAQLKELKESMEKVIADQLETHMREFHALTGIHIRGFNINVMKHYRMGGTTKILDKTVITDVDTRFKI